jgi:protein TonB
MNAATATPVSSNRRVVAAIGLSVVIHVLVLSGWHLRISPHVASMPPIEVSLVTENVPRLERRAPPRVARKPTPQPAPAEKATTPEPQPVENANAKPPPETSPPTAARSPQPTDSISAWLSRPEPPYPLIAKRKHVEGTVLLSVYVRADGVPGDVKVEKSSGDLSLDASAKETVRRWRADPAQLSDTITAVQVRFRLDG